MKKITNIISLTSGIIFGFALVMSDMTSPDRVKGFLDVTGNWDPTLLFVMVGAIFISFIGHYFLSKKAKPHFSEKWHFPWEKKGNIDKRLVIGSITFGIGWGIGGLCPGPAFASILFFNTYILYFLGSMLFSMIFYRLYFGN